MDELNNSRTQHPSRVERAIQFSCQENQGGTEPLSVGPKHVLGDSVNEIHIANKELRQLLLNLVKFIADRILKIC